jgi:type III secretion protein S
MVEILFRESLWRVALVSGLPLGACVITGLTISIAQSLTQIQEQSLGFTVKFITVSLVLFLCGGWLGGQILDLVQECFAAIQQAGR